MRTITIVIEYAKEKNERIAFVSNDGGFTGTPNLAFYTPDGTWDVENHGVPPDIEVELDPKVARDGHDSQLDKAVEVVLDLLKKNPPPPPPHHPPFANYQKSANP